MATTPKNYSRRLLGLVGKSDPVKILSSSPRKLEKLLAGVSASKGRKRPGRGKWSIAEIVAHLAETELVVGYRLRLVASANKIKIQVMDQDAWVLGGHYNRRPLKQSLEHFRSQRKANLDFLRGLSRKQWSYYGRHPERGRETIRHTALMYAGHDINHLKQIEAIKKSFRNKNQ